MERGDTEAEAADPDATVPARAVEDWDATAPVAGGARAAVLPAVDPLVGGTALFAGRFELVRKLGQGGMGAVYHARDRQVNGREVALKVLLERYSKDPQFRELFFQEIHAAQKFVSENVVQVRDTGQAPDGTLFLTMDLVQGESLRSLIDREQALNARQALEVARQVLLGLQSGHEHGFVHRDVKPSNVMLAARVPKTDDNPFGIGVRLLDFGIAGLAAQLDAGTLTGTPKYMSPEQVQAQRLDARSDLFAVGVMLYEMIAGARPFEGETLEEITTSVIETDVAPMIQRMGELSPPVRKILQRALQKDREKRFQNTAEFIRAIERSRAFKIPRVMPVWAFGVLLVALAGNGVQAKLLHDMDAKLESGRKDLAMVTVQAQSPLNEEIAALRRTVTDRDKRIVDLEQERTELSEQLREVGDSQATGAGVAAAVDVERSLLRRDLDDLTKKFGDLEQLYRAALEQNASYERQQLANARSATPEGRMATAFDQMVSFAHTGSGRAAKATFVALQPKGTFDQVNLHGRSFVAALVEAADQLHDLRDARLRGERPETAQLAEAQRLIALAEGELPELERQGRSWLLFTASDQDAAPDRLGAARGALAALAGDLAEMQSDLAGSAVDRWEEIAANGLLQEPAVVMGYAREHGPARASVFLGELAAELERTCVIDGALDVAALAPLAVLDAWEERLAQPLAGLEPSAVMAVRLFAAARRMHLGFETDASIADSLRAPPVLDGRTRDWRAEVSLLDECWRRGALWPVADRGRTIHYNERSEALRWRDTNLADSGNGAWRAAFRHYKDGGAAYGSATTATVVYEGRSRVVRHTLGAKQSVWIDLRLGPHVLGIEPLPPLPEPQSWPRQFGLSESQLAAFRDEYERSATPCLVVRTDEGTAWLSPQYGLVRFEPHQPTQPLWTLAFTPPGQ